MLLPLLFALAIPFQPLDVTTLFDYLTGATAFLFIIVAVLIFVYIYDNLRRGRRGTTATTNE